jgi:hypothetical protein
MALNQINHKSQYTIHKQMQSLSEYTKLAIVNDMLRSCDLENENNHENIEDLEDGPYDYLLQSTAWLPSYDPQYCLQRKLGLNTKKKTGDYQSFQSKRKQELNSL